MLDFFSPFLGGGNLFFRLLAPTQNVSAGAGRLFLTSLMIFYPTIPTHIFSTTTTDIIIN
jgi:site-specific DNA-adenine methylase